MENRKVKREDLKPGDIILLTPIPGDSIGKLISVLTDAPVSHATMGYYDTIYVIEENEPNVQINILEKKIANRSAYVLRHEDTTLDFNKVIDIAKKYYDEEVPFAKNNLYIMGIYFLATDITKCLTGPLQGVLTSLFYIGMTELVKIYSKRVYGKVHAMTCSQFVYHCYRQAGEQYQLKLKNPLGENSLLKQVKAYIESNPESNGDEGTNWNSQQIALKEDVSQEEKDQVLEALYSTLMNGKEDRNGSLGLTESLVEAVSGFMKQAAVTFCGITGENLEVKSVSDIIELFLDNEEYLVSPGDLLNNCANLELLGILEE